MEANSKSNKVDLIKNDMKQICKNIQEKHLEGRKFDTQKIKKWAENIINDIEISLKKKYPEYGYGIFFIYLIKLVLQVITVQFIIMILI